MLIDESNSITRKPNREVEIRVMAVCRVVLVFALLAIVFSPVFFAIYRTMIFNTLPRDDYAPYVLWLLHAPGGQLPGSPYTYRVLTAAVAAAIFHFIPLVHFSQLPGTISPLYAKATEAVALLSYLSVIGTLLLAYLAARKIYQRTQPEALAAAVIAGVSLLYSAYWAIDPPAILAIFIGVLLVERRWLFALFILATIFFNEKILIVFAGIFAIRSILARGFFRTHLIQIVATALAIAIYLGTVHVLAFSGNNYQLTPSLFLHTVFANLHFLASTKGAYLDDLPYVLLLFLWWRGGGVRQIRRARIRVTALSCSTCSLSA